jgi:hypothetical protein
MLPSPVTSTRTLSASVTIRRRSGSSSTSTTIVSSRSFSPCSNCQSRKSPVRLAREVKAEEQAHRLDASFAGHVHKDPERLCQLGLDPEVRARDSVKTIRRRSGSSSTSTTIVSSRSFSPCSRMATLAAERFKGGSARETAIVSFQRGQAIAEGQRRLEPYLPLEIPHSLDSDPRQSDRPPPPTKASPHPLFRRRFQHRSDQVMFDEETVVELVRAGDACAQELSMFAP